jgi:phage tail sheath protein FI
MPIAPTYPGVYVEEVPSGVRTIVGVATSITAFVGRTLRGPVNTPVTITSFGDFERAFGGLWLDNVLGHSVAAFFRNGGSQAVVVRLYHNGTEKDDQGNPVPARAKLTVGGMTLEAASEGKWAAGLRATVDNKVSSDIAKALNVKPEELFNLTVTDLGSGASEIHRNVTVVKSIRRVDQILTQTSGLVRWAGAIDPPPKITPGDDPVTVAEADVTKAQKAEEDAATELKAAEAEQPQDQAKIDQAKKKLEDATKEVANKKDAVAAAVPNGSNGARLDASDFLPDQGEANKKGLFALEDADLFNLLVIPPYKADGDVDPAVVTDAATYCEKRRAMLLVDPPVAWSKPKDALNGKAAIGTVSKNASLFFPRVLQPDPLREFRDEVFAPSGAVAGIMARTDATRGVWKAPAGLEATLAGVSNLSVALTDPENGLLNPAAINCLRVRPVVGSVVWGSRTLQGDDQLASEWKYIPVRRTALYIEESLYRGTQWVVFEPNDEPLWSQIRLNVTVFMQDLFRQGAFQGSTPNEAYLVKVDKETTTQSDINRGIVNIIVGFAPLKPAEFVFLKIQQLAGQLEA